MRFALAFALVFSFACGDAPPPAPAPTPDAGVSDAPAQWPTLADCIMWPGLCPGQNCGGVPCP